MLTLTMRMHEASYEKTGGGAKIRKVSDLKNY